MNFADPNSVVFLDGTYVPWADAQVHLSSYTMHYGLGVFEGIRCYTGDQRTAIFRLKEHMQRLLDSCKIMLIDLDADHQSLLEMATQIVKKNQVTHGYIRPLVYYSNDSLGIKAKAMRSHLACFAWDWGAYVTLAPEATGMRLKTVSLRRIDINSHYVKAKANGHYINSYLALKEALATGADDALLLDHQGFVAEGSAANFFMVKNQIVYTPPLPSVLAGITRDSVITLMHDLQIPIIEKNFAPDEVYIADEAFFTGTAIEVTPISHLDDRSIGTGEKGPITTRLQQYFSEVVRAKHAAYNDWLHFID